MWGLTASRLLLQQKRRYTMHTFYVLLSEIAGVLLALAALLTAAKARLPRW